MKKILYFLVISLCGISSALADIEQDLGAIVVTPNRVAQDYVEAESNVSVITSHDIKASGADNIADLLKGQLGVNVYHFSATKTAKVDIRGFGEWAGQNVMVLVDGRKITPVDISGADFLQIPLGVVERIEVVRGVSSVLYGDNASGGVINIITRKGAQETEGSISSEFGSYSRRGFGAEVLGSIDQFNYSLYSRYREESGFRSNSDLLAKDINTRFDYALTDSADIDLRFGWHENQSGAPGGLNASELALLTRRGSTNADESNYTNTKDRYVALGSRLKPWGSEQDLIDIDVSFQNRDTYGTFFGSASNYTKSDIDTFGLRSKYVMTRDIFDDQSYEFIAGIDFYDAENEILGDGFFFTDTDISKEEYGLYLNNELELIDDLFASAGWRYHQADYTFNQHNKNVFEEQHPSENVYSAGLKYVYGQQSNVFFNVEETFRFLATDEWYSQFSGSLDTSLRPQTGVQYQTGIRHNFDNKTVVGLTSFWLDLDNEIYVNPTSGSNGNYDQTRRIGVEFSVDSDMTQYVTLPGFKAMDVFLRYTYQQPTFRGGSFDGDDIPLVPRQLLTAGFNSQIGEHFHWHVTGSAVGSRQPIGYTTSGTSRLKSHYLVNTKFVYDFDDVELSLSVNNLFDEKYFSLRSYGDFYPAEERHFLAGVKVKF